MIPLLVLIFGGAVGGTGLVGGLALWCRSRHSTAASVVNHDHFSDYHDSEDDDPEAQEEIRLLKRLEDGTSYQSVSAAARIDARHNNNHQHQHLALSENSRPTARKRHSQSAMKTTTATATAQLTETHDQQKSARQWRRGAQVGAGSTRSIKLNASKVMATSTLQAGAIVRAMTPEKALLTAAAFCTNSRVFDVETLSPATLCASQFPQRQDAHLFHFFVCTKWKKRRLVMQLRLCPPPRPRDGVGGVTRHHKQPLQIRGAGAVDFGQLIQQQACSELLRLAADHAPRFILKLNSFNFCVGGAAVIRTLPAELRTLDEWIPLPKITDSAAAAAVQDSGIPAAGDQAPVTHLSYFQTICYTRDILRGLHALRQLDVLHAHLLPEHVVINFHPALELQLQSHRYSRHVSHGRLGVAQLTAIELNFLPGIGHRYSHLLPSAAVPSMSHTKASTVSGPNARLRGATGLTRSKLRPHPDQGLRELCINELPDIFLLGCCMYEMTTARVFTGNFNLAFLKARVLASFPHHTTPVHDGKVESAVLKPSRQHLADLVSVIAYICNPHRDTRRSMHPQGQKMAKPPSSTIALLSPSQLLKHKLFSSVYDPLLDSAPLADKVQKSSVKHPAAVAAPNHTDLNTDNDQKAGDSEEYSIYDDEDDPESWLRPAAIAGSVKLCTTAEAASATASDQFLFAELPPGCRELVGRTCSLRLARASFKDGVRQLELRNAQHGKKDAHSRSGRFHHTRRYRRH